MRAKTLLAAGIVRDIEFRSSDDFDLYLYDLDLKKITYKVLDIFTRDEGSLIVRIVQQYNSTDLIRL